MKPLPKAEFFRRFNKICNRRLMGGSVMTECPKCKGTAKLVAWLTLPQGGDFSEIDCPKCGPIYKGIKVVGAEVKPEKIGEKPVTRVTEPTTQDIVASVHSFSGSMIFKEKIAARAKCSMDRLNVVLEELEKKRAVRDMGAMVEVL